MRTNAPDEPVFKRLLIVLVAVLLLPALFMTVGMLGFGSLMRGMWGGHMWSGGSPPGWMVVVGLLMQLVVLAVVAGAGYLVYRGLTASDGGADQALEELRLAYARGDLSEEEYEQRKATLEREP